MIAVVIVLIAQASGAGYKQPGVKGYDGGFPLKYEPPLAEQLELTIRPAKTEFEAGEALQFDVVATNVSREPVLCHCPLAMGALEIEYRRVGETFRAYGQKWRHPEIIALYRLEPGEAAGHTTRGLAYDPGKDGVLFDAPGDYEIRVTHYDTENRTPESRLAAPPVRVRVRPPSDPEAFAAYKGNVARMVHFPGGNPSDDRMQEAANFLTRFGSSVYAPAVKRTLAAVIRWRLYDENGNVRPDATEYHRALYHRFGPPVPAR